jgi:predicted AAA+ superfamily ATPase
LSGHPSFGALWEQIVLSNIKGVFQDATIYYYRTTNGSEIDFVLKLNNKTFAIECKASFTPSLSKGNYFAIEDISPDCTFVVTPAPESWSLNKGIEVVSMEQLLRLLQ